MLTVSRHEGFTEPTRQPDAERAARSSTFLWFFHCLLTGSVERICFANRDVYFFFLRDAAPPDPPSSLWEAVVLAREESRSLHHTSVTIVYLPRLALLFFIMFVLDFVFLWKQHASQCWRSTVASFVECSRSARAGVKTPQREAI